MDDTRKALEEAFREMHGQRHEAASAMTCEDFEPWAERHDRFTAMLDCGAYLDAAMMLVPEGWNVLMAYTPTKTVCDIHTHPLGLQGLWPGHAEGPTPALALLGAIREARKNDAG